MEEETQISSSFYIEEDVEQPNHQERTKSLPGSSSSSSDLISRKISCAFSETDSGVDVESEEHAEDSFENSSVEKKVIKPDHHVISRLCNFDEEDESSEDSSDNDTCVEEDDEDHAPAPVKSNPERMTLSLVEVRHIMCALISEHIEVRDDSVQKSFINDHIFRPVWSAQSWDRFMLVESVQCVIRTSSQ